MSALYPAASIGGQVALVTGASSGIGASCAWRFAEAGASVVLLARRTDRLSQMKLDIESKFPEAKVLPVTLDVQKLDDIAKLPETLPEPFRNVDILVNNAGLVLGVKGAHENNMDDVKTMMDTNVTSVMAFTRAFTPGMLERGRGHVINISSIAGHEAYGGGSVYCATKHAIDAFTTAARHDLVGTPIRVTAISPGAVRTEFSVVRFGGDKDKADAVYAGLTPLNGDDIADNVMYACTRPAHVQIADMITFCTAQSSAKGLARNTE